MLATKVGLLNKREVDPLTVPDGQTDAVKSNYPGYEVFTFTGSETLTVNTQSTVDVLIVAGGGHGRLAGGGGGGGLRHWTGMVLPTGTYNIVVGAGGSASSVTNGGNSSVTYASGGNSFTNFTASGGARSQDGANESGLSGGSGGGAVARGFTSSNYNNPGTGNVGGDTTNINSGTRVSPTGNSAYKEGHNGGGAPSTDDVCGGGGGSPLSAGYAGTAQSSNGGNGNGGNGGAPYSTNIQDGTTKYYAGGGGGGGRINGGGSNGRGGNNSASDGSSVKGGATDGNYNGNVTAAVANTGGGSGGTSGTNSYSYARDGGSGIVIIRRAV